MEILAPVNIRVSVSNLNRIWSLWVALIEGIRRVKKKFANIITGNIKSILCCFRGFEPAGELLLVMRVLFKIVCFEGSHQISFQDRVNST